uniref:Galanin receptor GalR2-like protein n=1 Tax=Adineta vaga TaxID=104782 RepID=B3G4K4_ADIVA|nr:galanin receptor GalR2-like protein [Adineta vaga]
MPENFLEILNTVQYLLYHYVLPIFIALGTVGNILNLIVFLQPYLRKNPCSIYVLAYTIASICWIDFIALTASFSVGFSFDFSLQSPISCRIRTYIVYVTINLLPAFLILTAFNRMCVSSKRSIIRQYSTMKMAAYSICGVTLFWLLFNIPALIYTNVAQLPTGQSICTPLPDNFFNKFIFIFFAVSYGLLPPIILIILGSITLTNLIRTLNTVLPITELCQYRPNKKEQQLMIMVLIQICVTVLSQFPSSAFQVYAVVTRDDEKSYERLIVELFVYNLLVFILFLPPCLSFYVYFTTAKTFRNELKHLIRTLRCF